MRSSAWQGRSAHSVVLVNVAFRQSFLGTGSGEAAYLAFLGFSAVCVVLTWAVYLRPQRRIAGV